MRLNRIYKKEKKKEEKRNGFKKQRLLEKSVKETGLHCPAVLLSLLGNLTVWIYLGSTHDLAQIPEPTVS